MAHFGLCLSLLMYSRRDTLLLFDRQRVVVTSASGRGNLAADVNISLGGAAEGGRLTYGFGAWNL